MKLTPYKKILKYSKEKIQEALAPVRAHQARLKAQLKIAEISEIIANQEQKIAEICAEHPLDFDKLIAAQDELALNERRIAQIEKIIAELFDAEDEEESSASKE